MKLSHELFHPKDALTAPVDEPEAKKSKQRQKLVRVNGGGTEKK